MPNRTVVGIFDDSAAAERACQKLIESGVARHRIVMAHDQRPRADWLATMVGRIPDPHEFDEAVRGATCVVAVVARTQIDKRQIADLMLRNGARGTVEAPA